MKVPKGSPLPEPHARSVRYGTIQETVSHIPRGKVATYGEIARLSGFIGQARLVGYALHNLPRRTTLPWHRVINAKGEISLPRLHGQYQRQKRLLAKEGVVFKRGKIDLDKFGWIRSLGIAGL